MSAPRLLLVDDSDAVLAYEQAVLGPHYQYATASTGLQCLARAREARPDLILLDLSMPELDGEETLKRLKADPALREVPVLVVSSEVERARATTRKGATGFVPKPLEAERLRDAVIAALAEVQKRKSAGSLAVLFVEAAGQELGLPLDGVREVVAQPLTRALPGGPGYLDRFVELRGEPVCVLDLPRRLGRRHAMPLVERKLVVLWPRPLALALSVDLVRAPEELPASEVLPGEQLGGADEPTVRELLRAMVRTSHGAVPVIEPEALLSAGLRRELPRLLQVAREA